MKYAIITYRSLDDYTEKIFDTYEEAEAYANTEWSQMTDTEKATIEFYDIMHGYYNEVEGFNLAFADSVKSFN